MSESFSSPVFVVTMRGIQLAIPHTIQNRVDVLNFLKRVSNLKVESVLVVHRFVACAVIIDQKTPHTTWSVTVNQVSYSAIASCIAFAILSFKLSLGSFKIC